ncbi:MAG: cytochrome P450 [Chloroflexi bacterium]|nr:cytochrome P450 [Chloroflexota bacterium]
MRTYPMLGLLPQFSRDPVNTLVRLAQEQGGVAVLPLGPRRLYLVTSPTGVQHILKDHAANYIKGRTMDVPRPLLGENLVSAEGETWHRLRRLVQPAFSRRRLLNTVDTIAGTVEEFFPQWDTLADQRTPTDVVHLMMEVTLAIIARIMFSVDILEEEERLLNAFNDAMHALNRIAWSPWPRLSSLYVRSHPTFRKAKATLDEVVYRIIRSRRASGAERSDLLDLLMKAKDPETGEQLGDEELRNQALTVFLAGHETTALALSWTWYLLSTHPQVDREFRAEVQEVLGERPFTREDVDRLTYTRMVIDEVLRLYPSVWVTARDAVAEDQIDGVRIPAGARVIVSPYVTHRNPDLWPAPEAFDPERFRNGVPQDLPPFAYYPFSGGPRKCLGYFLAPLEMTVILALVARRYQLALVPGYPVRARPVLTLRPHPGVYMWLERTG